MAEAPTAADAKRSEGTPAGAVPPAAFVSAREREPGSAVGAKYSVEQP
jgi:hypothetical protein